MSYYETASDSSLIDDIDSLISEIKYQHVTNLENPEEYDSEFDDLPEELWQEQQDKIKLSILQNRQEKLNELYWSFEALRDKTTEEIERLESVLE